MHRLYPLHQAARDGNLDRARELLDQGHDVHGRDNTDSTPLHDAAMFNHVEMARFLLDRGADLEARCTRDGYTPLHSAVMFNHVEMARFLLKRGADLEARDKHGYTSLHDAVRSNSVEMAGYLLDQGADVEARNNCGDTPLHKAARFNRVEMTRFLLDRGADLEARNKDGRTPLHMAQNVASAKSLVEYGFDPSISGFQPTWMCPSILFLRDNRGKTPLEHCEKWEKEKAKYFDSFESLPLVDPATMQLSAGEAGLDQFQRFLARRVYYIVLCKIPIGHDVALRVMAFLSPVDVMK
jgi:ankyrin repeat protein